MGIYVYPGPDLQCDLASTNACDLTLNVYDHVCSEKAMQRLPGQPEATQFKVPMIGDANVGKTSIVSRFTTANFEGETEPTVGVSTANIAIDVRGEKIEMSIWDTAGQEKFRSLVPLYTRHAALLILVFDMSSKESFAGVETWVTKIKEEMGVTCPIFLCGNKCDLPDLVDEADVKKVAERDDMRVFFTSALQGTGVKELFVAAAETLANTETESQFTGSANLAPASEKRGCC